MSGAATEELIRAEADQLAALGETAPRLARDPVNQPQVHTWLEAIGDPNPVFRDTPSAHAMHGGPVAPPAMAQVWTMHGLGLPGEDPLAGRAGDPLHQMMGVLDEAGFTSVLGTNCDQTYDRYLRPGERVSVTTRLESVVGPKRTGVGEGWFVTTCSVWRVGDEQVATMMFRVLRFRPGTGRPVVDRTQTVRPVVSRDTAYFWEGTRAGELRVQQCQACGALRHPPGPVCPQCLAMDQGYVVAGGGATVVSYVVHHAPPIPGRQLPLRLGLVELDERVRMVGELRGDPAIGDRVEAVFDRVDDELVLVAWRVPEVVGSEVVATRASTRSPSGSRLDHQDGGSRLNHRQRLAGWELPVTTTLVVSTALATRDFQDVHHDRDLALQRGSADIFLNILTTTGLVQRYVGAWAGPAAVVRSCALRLGAPAHPGDTLAFTGEVADVVEVGGETRHVVDVVGRVSRGDHVTAQVTVVLR